MRGYRRMSAYYGMMFANQPTSARGGIDVRVYDDTLLLTADGYSERVSFSFVSAVSVQDDVLTIEIAGREPVMISGQGCEFGDLVSAKIAESRGRTAAFVAALLPRMDAVSLRRTVALLRDGAAVPAASLDAIHPGTSATLLEAVTLPQRREPLAELQRRMPLAIGFRPVTSIPRAATGTVTPDSYGHQNRGWPYGSGANDGEPTVFVVGRTGESVVFEVVNRLAPVTWVYRSPGPGGLMAADRALDAAGFAPPPAAGSPLLAEEVPHDDVWASRLAALP
jgi:hypothetical protein